MRASLLIVGKTADPTLFEQHEVIAPHARRAGVWLNTSSGRNPFVY
jgi:hypothetical protein